MFLDMVFSKKLSTLLKQRWLEENHKVAVATCRFYCILKNVFWSWELKHATFLHNSCAWRLQNITFALIPAPGG
jgi:hypothetical protein